MRVVGIDLSGPSNVADTVAVVFRERAGGLVREEVVEGAADEQILALISRQAERGEVVVGLDAPLSCNPGGGDRPGDASLRKVAVETGLRSGSVMPPTFNRMVYLTLRGMTVARMLEGAVSPPPRIVEVHPGVAMAARGAEAEVVRAMKGEPEARRELLAWLEGQGLAGVVERECPTDHYVAACAAALAAWRWGRGESVWLHPAEPPWHPYDFAV